MLALVLASPWMIVRFLQDGVPFATMREDSVIGALTGSQHMQHRAYPGTFVLAALLGFLPGTAMLIPAVQKLWRSRTSDRLARFLIAWIVGYLVFSEAFSSEPGTYAVQVLFPAMALAVAGLVVAHDPASGAPRYHMALWPPLAALFALGIYGGIYAFTDERPSLLAAVMIAGVVALFYISAVVARRGDLMRWAASGVAALALFSVTLTAIVFPAINDLWPAREIKRAIAACPSNAISLVGFREPSGAFLTGASGAVSTPEDVARVTGEKTPRLLIIEDRYEGRVRELIAQNRSVPLPAAAACINVYNVMRGCPLKFRVYDTGAGARCRFPAEFDCKTQPPPPAWAQDDCD
jgi:4-amino-4-deoxy-L-arabinose transferase-like glycosyltransferase